MSLATLQKKLPRELFDQVTAFVSRFQFKS